MKTPFTPEQFFTIFEKYNQSVFPVQLIFILLAIGGLFLLHSKFSSIKNRLLPGFLGLLWIWNGLIYHMLFFAEINKAAYVFGGLFILQGLLFLWTAFRNERFVFVFRLKAKELAGYFFILFGLIAYPIIGYLAGATATRTISLGLPCPTTIVTFGLLMLAGGNFPRYLLIIPSLWALVGFSAAFNFGVYQDFMLPVSAIVADIYLVRRKR